MLKHIAIHDVDFEYRLQAKGNPQKYPNLALMKISAYYKKQGVNVKWYDPLFDKPDIIYSSKIFNFTPNFQYNSDCKIIRGGTGYDIKSKLSMEIETMQPDYSIYPSCKYSLGFLTRGCPNKCSWCVVPEKEGDIHTVADIEDIAIRRDVVLMDNNILASKHGIQQIEKIGKMNIKIDFNQGLDARLIDNSIAKLLSKCKWLKPVRLACDTKAQMPIIEKAVKLLRDNNCTPKRYFCYVLVKDIDDALERVEFLRKLGVTPFAQPYRDICNLSEPTKKQKLFANWVNKISVFKTTTWENFGKSHKRKKYLKEIKEKQLAFEF